MSIRLQLLIVALTTLVLPWAGWQYARELESALRGSQEQSLLASAGTIANALSSQPQRVFRNAEAHAFDAKSGELLWEQKTNSGIMGMPVSYEVDGTQYIAIQSGWGVDAQRIQDALATQNVGVENNVPQGGVVWVFAVKK